MAAASHSHLDAFDERAGGAAPLDAAVHPLGAPGKASSAREGSGDNPHLVRGAPEAHRLYPPDGWYLPVKDGLDRVAAFLLLLLTSPLLLVGMALVKLTSRGPALYSQVRLGRYGQPFTLYKVRSMIVESESLTGACWSTPGDQRVTTVGRWLRRSHLDELPQLWNVLRGDMSLIGPRPERPEFVPLLEQAIPFYRDRLLVRPGISGFAQVQLPPDTNLDSVRTKLAFDLYYVHSVGLWFDLRIGWATVFKMIGASFSFMARTFRFPTRDVVEEQYRIRIDEAQRRKGTPKNGTARGDIRTVPALH